MMLALDRCGRLVCTGRIVCFDELGEPLVGDGGLRGVDSFSADLGIIAGLGGFANAGHSGSLLRRTEVIMVWALSERSRRKETIRVLCSLRVRTS